MKHCPACQKLPPAAAMEVEAGQVGPAIELKVNEYGLFSRVMSGVHSGSIRPFGTSDYENVEGSQHEEAKGGYANTSRGLSEAQPPAPGSGGTNAGRASPSRRAAPMA